MITPTVGRVVWYRALGMRPEDQPYAAQIAKVLDDHTINIGYLDDAGHHWAAQHVRLVQDGEKAPDGAYCEWMPYQKGMNSKPTQTSADRWITPLTYYDQCRASSSTSNGALSDV